MTEYFRAQKRGSNYLALAVEMQLARNKGEAKQVVPGRKTSNTQSTRVMEGQEVLSVVRS